MSKLKKIAQVNASLSNLRDNMNMKSLAKEILLEENYQRFMKSYKFTFYFQLIGILAGFIVPIFIFYFVFKDIVYCAFGLTIGIIWMIFWLIISMFIPQAKIYLKFAKWYRSTGSIKELDVIFYEK